MENFFPVRLSCKHGNKKGIFWCARWAHAFRQCMAREREMEQWHIQCLSYPSLNLYIFCRWDAITFLVVCCWARRGTIVIHWKHFLWRMRCTREKFSQFFYFLEEMKTHHDEYTHHYKKWCWWRKTTVDLTI